MARIAKPGFDVRTATPEQCIIHESKIPLKLARSGYFTIGASGATVTVDLRGDYGNDVLVDYQVEQIGDAMFVPPYPTGDGNNEFLVEYKIDGTDLIFRNSGPHEMGVRFFVMAENGLPQSVGSGRVFERGDGYVAICKPGTDGTRLVDRIYDTRFQAMPIIAQAYVPIASAVASDASYKGTKMHVASWSNPGFKPYVVAKKHAVSKSNPNLQRFFPLFSKGMSFANYCSVDTSFMFRLTDTQAKFYFSNGEAVRFEDSYRPSGGYATTASAWNTLGIRYYVFAVPDTL